MSDRVELTDDEREALLFGFGIRFYENADHTRFAQGVAVVESIVAARVQALTAERDEWKADYRRERDTCRKAQAELAAANDRIAELTELFDGLRDDYQKACEEVERLQHHDWEDENATLQATLDRVTAAAKHPHKGPNDTDASMLLAAASRLDAGYMPGGSNTTQTVARVLRAVAALTPEGTE